MSWSRIAGFRLVSHDPERLARFYVALGFAAGAAAAIPADDMALLGLAGGGRRVPLALGPSRLDIDGYDRAGRPYPTSADAASLAFQHLALVTDDAASAWARAEAAGAAPISRERPVTLPPSSGGVTAIKFRDPDGHPLELLQFRKGASAEWHGAGILGIDHSAVSVAEVAASATFYAGHGLARGDATVNRGSTQVALDGLDDVVVDVVPLKPPAGSAHIELLGYRSPVPHAVGVVAPNDVAATRIVWHGDRIALIRDPDGHLHEVRPAG